MSKRNNLLLAGGLAATAVTGVALWLHNRRRPQPAPIAAPKSAVPRPNPTTSAERPARAGVSLPKQRTSAEQVLAAMRQVREHDVKWHEGKTWSLVYHITDDVAEFLKEAYTLFFSENGLNPMAFPSLKKFEAEVVAMAAGLLGGDEQTTGNMTSGGTESLLMAVKTARDWARANKPHITAPEMLLPATAHPAFEKAAHYFDVQPVHVPVSADFRADVEATRAALTPHTILMVGSAPSYPQGVIDPVSELAQIAHEHGILFHVDACVGGFMLPFVRRLGYPLPDFDFRVPGVTSISADLHKYAYAAKGASVILYKTAELRRHQFFAYADWSGGIYASPTMVGTRPAGPIAAAWAIMNHLGEEGYLEIADTVMQTVTRLHQGVAAIDGVHILGNPAMSILALGSDKLNIYEIGDELALRGWHMDRQQFPPGLHLTVTHAHAAVADQFLADLEQAVARARRFSLTKLSNSIKVGAVKTAAQLLPANVMSDLTARSSSVTGLKGADVPQRSAAMYGMMASLPNRGDLHELVLDVLDNLTQTETGECG